MKMGCSQKQSKSTQHRRWNRSSQPTRARNPVSFEKWALICLQKCEKKGCEFEFLCPGLIRISWPGRVPLLRTLADMEQEYESDYLSKF
jgi:hypothetical protein